MSKEQGRKLFFNSRLFLVLLAIGIFLIVYAYGRAYYQDYQVRQEIFRLQEKARNLEVKKIQLLDALKHVKSDQFIEEKARAEFNMIKPGEQVVVIDGNSAKTFDRQEKNNMIGLSGVSNIIKWWKYFFGNRN